MIKIRLICVGNLKEKFWVEAQNEYIKRLGKFCKFELVELPEKNQTSTPLETLNREGEEILARLEGKSFLFDVKARQISSEEFAELLQKSALTSSVLTFIIGSSHGVSEKVKKAAGEGLSFGKITLPHNLFRIVALEQIYRAFNILENTSYHK